MTLNNKEFQFTFLPQTNLTLAGAYGSIDSMGLTNTSIVSLASLLLVCEDLKAELQDFWNSWSCSKRICHFCHIFTTSLMFPSSCLSFCTLPMSSDTTVPKVSVFRSLAYFQLSQLIMLLLSSLNTLVLCLGRCSVPSKAELDLSSKFCCSCVWALASSFCRLCTAV